VPLFCDRLHSPRPALGRTSRQASCVGDLSKWCRTAAPFHVDRRPVRSNLLLSLFMSQLMCFFIGRHAGPLLLSRRSPVQLLAAVRPILRVNLQGLIAGRASGARTSTPRLAAGVRWPVGIKRTVLELEEGEKRAS
jgi:hypothetical protein